MSELNIFFTITGFFLDCNKYCSLLLFSLFSFFFNSSLYGKREFSQINSHDQNSWLSSKLKSIESPEDLFWISNGIQKLSEPSKADWEISKIHASSTWTKGSSLFYFFSINWPWLLLKVPSQRYRRFGIPMPCAKSWQQKYFIAITVISKATSYKLCSFPLLFKKIFLILYYLLSEGDCILNIEGENAFVFVGKKERGSWKDSRGEKPSMEQSSVSQNWQGIQAKCPNLAPKQKEHTESLWAKKGPSVLALKDPYVVPLYSESRLNFSAYNQRLSAK